MKRKRLTLLGIHWYTVDSMCQMLAGKLKEQKDLTDFKIIPVVRGGLVPATILSHQLDLPIIGFIDPQTSLTPQIYQIISKDSTPQKYLIVDEICDTGETFRRLKLFFNGNGNDNWHRD